LLAYDRVLEKCFWGPGKVLEFFVTKRVGTLQEMWLLVCSGNPKCLFFFRQELKSIFNIAPVYLIIALMLNDLTLRRDTMGDFNFH